MKSETITNATHTILRLRVKSTRRKLSLTWFDKVKCREFCYHKWYIYFPGSINQVWQWPLGLWVANLHLQEVSYEIYREWHQVLFVSGFHCLEKNIKVPKQLRDTSLKTLLSQLLYTTNTKLWSPSLHQWRQHKWLQWIWQKFKKMIDNGLVR